MTVWLLDSQQGRPESTVVRLRLSHSPPVDDPDALRVHPGHEWFLVLSGTVELVLEDRHQRVETGEAASFSTMVPHALGAVGGPAELLLVLDRDGDRAHLH